MLERPKLRGTTSAFASRLFGAHVTTTNALEALVIASFVRGLSVRDVEATLAEVLGDQSAISKSTVSGICAAIKDQYEAWTSRRLDGLVLDYLFLDASFFRMHPGSPAEPVLAAWGISTDGTPVFVGLIAAIEAVFAPALRQRCLIHRLRNIEAKIPTGIQAEIRDGFWACFDTAKLDIPPGPRLVEVIDARICAS